MLHGSSTFCRGSLGSLRALKLIIDQDTRLTPLERLQSKQAVSAQIPDPAVRRAELHCDTIDYHRDCAHAAIDVIPFVNVSPQWLHRRLHEAAELRKRQIHREFSAET